jgi:hypothetical protein
MPGRALWPHPRKRNSIHVPVTVELEQDLLKLLQAHPLGLSEFELLRQLQSGAQLAFDETLFDDDLTLYRAHFLLFHALYRLQERLVQERRGHLEIHVLSIRLLPWREAGETDLAAADPMRGYYLDLANLDNTTAEDLEKLLGKFWSAYFAQERRSEALAVLGLEEPATRTRIENRYRILAMRLHPDRGGNKREFQDLQQAIGILRRCAFE